LLRQRGALCTPCNLRPGAEVPGEQAINDDLPVVLIVEDEVALQSIVEEVLAEGGFETAIAPSGEEAVTLLNG
jgi:hypothetical protein